jgi:hypothetical protein
VPDHLASCEIRDCMRLCCVKHHLPALESGSLGAKYRGNKKSSNICVLMLLLTVISASLATFERPPGDGLRDSAPAIAVHFSLDATKRTNLQADHD